MLRILSWMILAVSAIPSFLVENNDLLQCLTRLNINNRLLLEDLSDYQISE